MIVKCQKFYAIPLRKKVIALPMYNYSGALKKCMALFMVAVFLTLGSPISAETPASAPMAAEQQASQQVAAQAPAAASSAASLSWSQNTAITPAPASAPLDVRTPLLKTLGGLMVIIAVILACAFVTKKWLIQPYSSHQTLKLVAQLTLGPKEKVAIIDVAGQQLLVGITAYNIRTLTELSQPISLPAAPEPSAFTQGISGEFAKKLQALMPKGQQP